MSDLEDFEVLSHALQIQVDAAFDLALKSSPFGLSPVKHSKFVAAANSECAGGFNIHSDDPPGIFIPSKANNFSDDDLIPLSLIPSALQYLDLPPDDEEVLQVFYHAAGGWGGAPRTDGAFIVSDKEQERAVTRKDWRAVCAVIIGNCEGEDVAGGFLIDEKQAVLAGVQENSLQEEATEDKKNENDEDEDENEAYQESSLSSLSSGSDFDEYTREPSASKTRSKSRGRKSKRTSAPISYDTPTSRQKRASLDAFALFFPSSAPLTDADLAMKRLMFKDIIRVADLLKEKIRAEDVEEMLSLFSTSHDKSISLEDFTRMMIMAKLAWEHVLIHARFGNRLRTVGNFRNVCLVGNKPIEACVLVFEVSAND